jgi:hypothetical protein
MLWVVHYGTYYAERMPAWVYWDKNGLLLDQWIFNLEKTASCVSCGLKVQKNGIVCHWDSATTPRPSVQEGRGL